jgi:hypothetical protein
VIFDNYPVGDYSVIFLRIEATGKYNYKTPKLLIAVSSFGESLRLRRCQAEADLTHGF